MKTSFLSLHDFENRVFFGTAFNSYICSVEQNSNALDFKSASIDAANENLYHITYDNLITNKTLVYEVLVDPIKRTYNVTKKSEI